MTNAIKILVIDDNEDDRLLYRRTLQKGAEGEFVVIEAESGEDGLKALKREAPDCILLDYSMPGYDGVEVLKQIRAVHPFVPVVMMTGQGNETVAVAAMREGAQHYIAKSTVTPDTLVQVIRLAIEHCAMQKRIDEQRVSLEVFTRALAHDLKEPVRTIRSFMELIESREKFSDKTQTYFQHVQNAAERMHTLIDTVYLYTRLDDPNKTPREDCDTSIILGEVQENLSKLIHERNTNITAEALPAVHANPTQVLQLFQNLVSNAINHCSKKCDVYITAEPHENGWLFRVQDNGPGIDPAYLEKIFEPFKRMSSDNDGTGLGLAICRRIVESHEGKIWCESTLGEGTTFLFTLPRAQREISDAPAITTAKAAMEENDKLLANVLLVDDSRADIEMTRIMLIEHPQLKCNLFTARDGGEALAHLYNGNGAGAIDLMLLDINMPEIDGFEILERMKSEEKLKDIAVVMCTGSVYDKDMEKAKKLGAIGYFTKPVKFDMLKALIERTQNMQLEPSNGGYTLLRAVA